MAFTQKMDLSRFSNAFTTVETHTVGEPTRIVLAGFPEIPGDTMMERKEYCEAHYDQLRSALMCEPRGHKDMVGAVLTDAVSPHADIGVIYMDANRWINMCGHASIGCATVAVEAGLVPATEPYTEVRLDTPAGVVSTRVRVEKGHAIEVTITNVPSFLYRDGVTVVLDGKDVEFDIAFGGSFFALVNADKLGIELNASSVPYLIGFTARLLEAANRQLTVRHPDLEIAGIANAEFYGEPLSPDAQQRNIVVSAEGQVDRSPCGTGTSAKLAMLYAHGGIKAGEKFVNENFTGARFTGMVKEETSVGDYRAIIPCVTGSAYICGLGQHLIDPADPLKYGFTI